MSTSPTRKEVDPMNHERPSGRNDNEHRPEDAGASETRAEQAHRPEARIYVASLADYNAGRLHGAWIDAAQDAEQIQAEIATMLERSREPLAEEWAIHDYEGFNSIPLSEYESIERISQIANGIAEYGAAFAAWISISDREDETVKRFEDAFRGSFASREAYAEEIVDDFGYQELIDNAIPDYLSPYVRFDADAYARDIELNGDIPIVDASDGTIHVFDAHA